MDLADLVSDIQQNNKVNKINCKRGEWKKEE